MSDFSTAFPNSSKDSSSTARRTSACPMREIALDGGEPPIRVYDTSGPQDHDVERRACRSCATPWVRPRGDDARRMP